MTAAQPLGETDYPQRSEEALAGLIGNGADLFVLAAMDDCVPCTLMRPIVRHLALRLSVALRLAEPATAPGFLECHAVERFPELLFFRNGNLLERRAGFHDFDDLNLFMRGVLGGSGEPAETAPDIAFRSLVDEAQAAVDAMMEPASAALAPFMAAAGAKLQALDARLGSVGEMTVDEANRLRRAEQVRIYAPFQDRIDALRHVQARAMRLYEEMTYQAVWACAASPSESTPTFVCSPDGSVCSFVAVVQGETAP
ncbi:MULTISPECIES: hypothetical protein [Bosea]|nr:hypothetical protein [Bosea vaviloviae]